MHLENDFEKEEEKRMKNLDLIMSSIDPLMTNNSLS
jgi:hypothetical protein